MRWVVSFQMEASAEGIVNVTQGIVAEFGLSKDVENVAKIRTVLLAQIASTFCFSFTNRN